MHGAQPTSSDSWERGAANKAAYLRLPPLLTACRRRSLLQDVSPRGRNGKSLSLREDPKLITRPGANTAHIIKAILRSGTPDGAVSSNNRLTLRVRIIYLYSPVLARIQDVYILITHLRKLFANSRLICVNIPSRDRSRWEWDDAINLDSGLVFWGFWPKNVTFKSRKFKTFF